MGYLPHAVKASMGQSQGVVVRARLSQATGRESQDYLIFVDIDLVGMPGVRTLRNVRYYGELYLPVVSDHNPATGAYDDLIEDALDAAPGASSEDKHAHVSGQVDTALKGLLVTPINVGGRWIVR